MSGVQNSDITWRQKPQGGHGSITKRHDVIRDVIKSYEGGLFITSVHAAEQMVARDVQLSDIEEMIYRAYREEHKDSLAKNGKTWKYALRGLNDNRNKDIRIIIAFNDSDAVIITVIDKNKKED